MIAAGAEVPNYLGWIGAGVGILAATLPTIVAWGRMTERMNSIQEAQRKMVSTEGMLLALEKMKTEMLDKLLTKSEPR